VALYEEFLGKPLSHKSHELLHTKYTAKSEMPEEEQAEEIVKTP